MKAKNTTKDPREDYIKARMVNLARFSLSLEPNGEIKLDKDKRMWTLPVVKSPQSTTPWHGSLVLFEDSNGNPNTVHLELSLS